MSKDEVDHAGAMIRRFLFEVELEPNNRQAVASSQGFTREAREIEDLGSKKTNADVP
jgi:hypothetical protein